jgi:hypothetical protein
VDEPIDVIDADAVDVTADGTSADSTPIAGAVSGVLVGFAAGGAPLVEIRVGAECSRFVARTCVPLHVCDLWRELVMVFDANNPEAPFVVGVVHSTGERSPVVKPEVPPAPREIEIDGRTLVLSAHETITLQCGEASITLQRDGRIVIRGKHVVSHASGVNRIRGGSVQLN